MASGSGSVPIGVRPGPAVAEYRQAPSVLALFSYSYGQVAYSTA
jgi:hypothetical protein